LAGKVWARAKPHRPAKLKAAIHNVVAFCPFIFVSWHWIACSVGVVLEPQYFDSLNGMQKHDYGKQT
jgi:hypothetical protein